MPTSGDTYRIAVVGGSIAGCAARTGDRGPARLPPVPATEVARRAGHGVAVLLKIYAHCIDGQATAANQRIAEALDIQDAEQDPGDEGDGDTEQAS